MILLIALSLIAPAAQDTLTLHWFQEHARANHPLLYEKQLSSAIADVTVAHLHTRFLPAFSLGGQAVYQSEVPVLPFNLPGSTPPEVAPDQYRIGLSVQQLIYDGGVTAQQQKLAYAQSELGRQEIEVELYSLKSRINEAYFNVLLLQAQMASLQTLETDITSKLQLVTSQIDAGLLLPGNADVLRAELIKIEQHMLETDAHRRAFMDMLGEWTGRQLAEDLVLEMPAVSINESSDITAEPKHPNFTAFAFRRSVLDQQSKLVARKNRFLISSTAEMAYGRPPGINIFENDFKPYYALGLKVTWTFWDWHSSDREQQVLALQQQVVDQREQAFSQEITLARLQLDREIEQLDAQLQKDEEIIALRQKIIAEASSRFENGVITATEYLLERNAEHQAFLNKQIHHIQLALAKVKYMTTIGADL